MIKEVPITEAVAKFMPYPAVFVISVDENEKPNGMVAAWQMRVSADPPMMAVSISKQGNTQKLIRQSKEFVVAVPNKGLEKEVRFFGSHHGDETNKFRETGIETLPSKKLKSPLIKEATINFECRLLNEVEAGDHFIFIGEIIASHTNENKKVLFQTKRVGKERFFEEF